MKFHEKGFATRTVSKYNTDVKELSLPQEKRGHVHGIKSECLLNEIPDYHILANYSWDIMNIV